MFNATNASLESMRFDNDWRARRQELFREKRPQISPIFADDEN